MSTTDNLLLQESALQDAEELAEEIGRPFAVEDVDSNEWGIDLRTAALHYVETYNGTNSFMTSMKSKKLVGAVITNNMLKVVLNIMREIKLSGGVERHSQERDHSVNCRFCKTTFVNQEAYDKHYDEVHAERAPTVQAPTGEVMDKKEVIEVQEGKLKLDLTQVPDGRFALPDLSGQNDYIFLMVKRVRKRTYRNKRYVYGKIITGSEWVEAGTIEVKIWSSDSKELIGQQKPGDYYRGKFEVQLQAVIAAPMPWAKLFGQLIGHCGICGKTLTDDISRSDGFGPECIKKIDANYFTKKRAAKFELRSDGRYDRPYCLEHQKYNCDLKHSFDDEETALL